MSQISVTRSSVKKEGRIAAPFHQPMGNKLDKLNHNMTISITTLGMRIDVLVIA